MTFATKIKGISFFNIHIILLTLFVTEVAQAQNWILHKQVEGIEVYTRKQENSSLKQIKIVTTTKNSLSSIVAILRDKSAFPNWVYACKNSNYLQIISDTESVHYQYTSMPWPLSDRDAIIHTTIHQDSSSKVVTIKAKSLGNYIKAKDGVVRVHHLQALWTFTPDFVCKTVRIEYVLNINPGGELPAWVVNLGITDGPLKTIKKMKELLPKYEQIQLSYIKN